MNYNDDLIKNIWSVVIGIPKTVSLFFYWFTQPINETYFNVSPMQLFTGLGVGVIITIITVHLVRLFI